jgi:hypothetical protein
VNDELSDCIEYGDYEVIKVSQKGVTVGSKMFESGRMAKYLVEEFRVLRTFDDLVIISGENQKAIIRMNTHEPGRMR